MATINPNLGPISTSTTVRNPAQVKPGAGESAPALPADGLSVDFSKGGGSAVDEKSAALGGTAGALIGAGIGGAALPPTPQAPSAPSPVVVGGVELAAADGGFSLSNTGGLAQLESPKAPGFNASIDGCLANLAQAAELLGTGEASEARGVKTITAANVNWDLGTEVVSNAQKFVIPVPQFADGGEPLVYPDGAKDKDGKDLGGTPIMDWQGQPIGDKGVVFFNQKDQAWQAVKADGQGVVIMNQMTEEQGKALMAKIGGNPANLTLEQFKDVLSYASSDEVGCKDMYNSDRSFISKKMNAMESSDTGVPQYGLFRRDDRDVCKVLFAEGPADFEAPSGGGVLVHQPIGEEGGVLLRQPDGKVFLYRKIDNEAFVETYTTKNGGSINLDELPRHKD